ncbi:protein ref(2)P-like [Pollicipes pollicipes]|uniref:protein ref(2)P-like n=1 Tax=Pollicipes pollicipes TaxID=41117 RepID=UPI0018858381|nr:protein ref(2)P-like [Pollicipes pollicipes]
MTQEGFPTMDGKNISVKAYLALEDGNQEIRRFGLDSSAATSFSYLQGKLQVVFPSLLRQQFNIRWEDADGDAITISSDEELLVALVSCLQVAGQQTLRLHVVPTGRSRHAAAAATAAAAADTDAADGPIHRGVCCDGCEQTICGHRYKCMSCDDYDLCAGCEARGMHKEHLMLRIPSPEQVWQPVFRHGRRSGRRAGHCTAWGGGRCGWPAGMSCPGGRRAGRVPEERAAVPPSAAAPPPSGEAPASGAEQQQQQQQKQPSNFFEAIHSAMSALGGFGPEADPAGAAAAGRWTEKSLEELGQTIAAVLDPFGIDVDVGVESRQKRPPVASDSAGPLDPRIQRALDIMSAMGFSNDGGWLTQLLQAKQGDIGAVLDVLQPVRPPPRPVESRRPPLEASAPREVCIALDVGQVVPLPCYWLPQSLWYVKLDVYVTDC